MSGSETGGPATGWGDLKPLELLGHGSAGSVYLAKSSAGALVAVKHLHLGASDDIAIGRFRQEAETLSFVNHPGVVALIELRQAGGEYLLLMEYVAGPTLRELLPTIGNAESVEVIEQLAAALDAVHDRGVVHRDIKPTNVLVTEDGLCKLVDFGIARFVGDTWHAAGRNLVHTRTGTFVGTPGYLAPEVASGHADIDRRADVYSLAALAYRMLVGRLPFEGGPYEVIRAHMKEMPPRPSDTIAEFPRGVEDVLLRALSKDAAHRHDTAGQFAAELAASALGWSGDRGRSARELLAELAARNTRPISSRVDGDDGSDLTADGLLVALGLPPTLPLASPPVFQPRRTRRYRPIIVTLAVGLIIGLVVALVSAR